MNKLKRQEIFARLRDANPHPTTELVYDSPFELLIAVMLSAQATDISVNKATGPLFAVANTPAAIKALGLKRLKSFIKTIGLFNTKAENVLKTCDILIDSHGGEVPESRDALEALPGVGRQVEEKLERLVPAEYKRDAHHWLILHGRYVCVARKPRCGACVIEDLCEFKDKTEVE